MSSFGEIAEPKSRSFWEDWDDEFYDNDFPVLQWLNTVEVPTQIDTLIILEGKYLSSSVKKRKSSLELVNSITEVNLHLYKVKTSNNYVCMIKHYNILNSSEVVELLYNYITVSDDIIVVIMKSLCTYLTSENLANNSLIRRISTNVEPKPMIMKYSLLEQPNMLSGLSAGVIWLREFLDMPASAVVFFIENAEAEDSKELQKFLAELNIVWKPKTIPELNSNMYI